MSLTSAPRRSFIVGARRFGGLVETGGVISTGNGLLGTNVLKGTQTGMVDGVQVQITIAGKPLVAVHLTCIALARTGSTELLSFVRFANVLLAVIAKET